jgi:uncharacterized membrane protein
MIQRLAPIYSTAWRAVVVLLAIEISVVSVMRYLTHHEAAPEPILANAYATPFLVIHVVSSVVALLAGPLQFVRRIRTRWPAFHRGTGWAYVFGCAIGAPSGFVLALGSSAGPIAGGGFAIVAVLTVVFTWLALRAAIERRFDDHRDWMLRSYAVLAGGITLRLMLPFSILVLGYDFFPAYRIIAWLSWSTNLLLVEWCIRRRRGSATTRAALAAA